MNNLRGAKIIYQESKATQPSHLYFLQKDENYCDAIITSESGAKRKLNINVDLSNYYTKTEVNTLINSIDLSNYYTKNEVDINLASKQDVLNYTPENIANKSDSYIISSSTTYASTKALVDGLSTKLDKGTYTGTAQDLKNSIDSKANISHTHDISSITNLQTALDDKQDKLSSYDESILIEDNGNIEGNVSLFQEYFEQQECELNFNPIQIVAVYQDGIKLLNSEYEIILPKKIRIKEYVDENIQIEYTHLKN